MKDVYLKEIVHESHQEPIYKWDYLKLDEREDIRVYYKPRDGKFGFDFYAVEHIGNVINKDTDKNPWHENYCCVDTIVWGIAYFDGIRHMYYGDKQTDNYGYHHYVDLKAVAHTLLLLEKLVKKYCDD